MSGYVFCFIRCLVQWLFTLFCALLLTLVSYALEIKAVSTFAEQLSSNDTATHQVCVHARHQPERHWWWVISCIYLYHWLFHQYFLFEVKMCVHFSSKKSHRSEFSEALNVLWIIFWAQSYLKLSRRRGLGAFLPLEQPSITRRLNTYLLFYIKPVLSPESVWLIQMLKSFDSSHDGSQLLKIPICIFI